MNGFKQFFEETELDKNLRDTLKKVPKSHANLIKDYKFRWQSGSTLKGDNEHVGIINPARKSVTVAAPWNYPREYTLLHELAHRVWAAFMTPELKKEWSGIVKKNPRRDKDENDEEQWCFNYANHFAKNKMVKHSCHEWEKFMDNFLTATS